MTEVEEKVLEALLPLIDTEDVRGERVYTFEIQITLIQKGEERWT